jgi:dihydrodipicolinate synthase/N-acetylneuraminate lyase
MEPSYWFVLLYKRDSGMTDRGQEAMMPGMSVKSSYRGVVVPMVSPFTPDGSADAEAVGRIVEHLLAGGVGGVFVLGTTGEAASISAGGKRKLVERTVRSVAGRAAVYAGISGNCLEESVEAARQYQDLGADVVVAHPPSYYPLNDAEIEAYFLRLAERVPLPLVLYNIPATTHLSIGLECVERLSRHEKIVAIKDSAGDRQRVSDLLERLGGRDDFDVLLGSSPLFSHGLKLGAVGIVPSGANLAPREHQEMYESAAGGRWEAVERLQEEINAVTAQYVKGRSLGQSLAMLKALMEQRGLCGRTMLPPLRAHEGETSAHPASA